MSVAVIIVAAGSGSRLGATQPKALVRVGDRTILEHSLATALAVDDLVEIVVVAPSTHLDVVGDLVAQLRPARPVTVVAGGVDRSASVAAGLAALDDGGTRADGTEGDPADAVRPDDEDVEVDLDGQAFVRGEGTVPPFGTDPDDDLGQDDALGADEQGAGTQVVLVHDAARCFTPVEVFERVAAAVRDGWVAVVPGLPVVDTIKVVDARGVVSDTPSRAALRAIQTPQGFLRGELEAAHAGGLSATDDAALLEALGHQVLVVDGDPAAFKVTTPADLELAQRRARERVQATPSAR